MSIKNILSSIPDETIIKVTEALLEIGVSEENDLEYVEERDLQAVLKPIPIRKLLHAWKLNKGEILYYFI